MKSVLGIQDIGKYTELAKETLNKAIVSKKTFGLIEEPSDGIKLTDLGK
jgi:hypothetical protein